MYVNQLYKRLIIGMLLCFFLTALSARFFLTRQDMGLKGPVKNYREIDNEGNRTHYHFSHTGELQSYWFEGYEYYHNSMPPVTFKRSWDTEGRLVAVMAVTETGDERSVLEYGYSGDGKLEHIVEYSQREFRWKMPYTKCIYDSMGRAVESQERDANDNMTERNLYFYNGLGKLTREELWAGTTCEELYYFVNHSYSEEGYLTLDEGDNWRTEYSYNSDGSLRQRRYMHDIYIETYDYRYDESGRLVEVTATSVSDNWTEEQYSYDAWGNITYKLEFPADLAFEYDYYK